MDEYLRFELGDSETTRGRLLLHIQEAESKEKEPQFVQKLVDIRSAPLKEALFDQILNGRLLFSEIFEPSYVNTYSPKELIPEAELEEFAKKEFRDLVIVNIQRLEKQLLCEVVLEQVIARYTNICRDNVYIKLLQELADEIFRQKDHYSGQSLYIAIFKVVRVIFCMLRERRDNDIVELELYRKELMSLKQQLTPLDFDFISDVLIKGGSQEWQELTEYLDIFYLTLKKDLSLSLREGVRFSVNSSCQKWMEENLCDLYYQYFRAILQEHYEKAIVLKQEIDEYFSSQSLKC